MYKARRWRALCDVRAEHQNTGGQRGVPLTLMRLRGSRIATSLLPIADALGLLVEPREVLGLFEPFSASCGDYLKLLLITITPHKNQNHAKQMPNKKYEYAILFLNKSTRLHLPQASIYTITFAQ
jgi:hypothetical protein